jgi:hypothetical protein
MGDEQNDPRIAIRRKQVAEPHIVNRTSLSTTIFKNRKIQSKHDNIFSCSPTLLFCCHLEFAANFPRLATGRIR